MGLLFVLVCIGVLLFVLSHTRQRLRRLIPAPMRNPSTGHRHRHVRQCYSVTTGTTWYSYNVTVTCYIVIQCEAATVDITLFFKKSTFRRQIVPVVPVVPVVPAVPVVPVVSVVSVVPVVCQSFKYILNLEQVVVDAQHKFAPQWSPLGPRSTHKKNPTRHLLSGRGPEEKPGVHFVLGPKSLPKERASRRVAECGQRANQTLLVPRTSVQEAGMVGAGNECRGRAADVPWHGNEDWLTLLFSRFDFTSSKRRSHSSLRPRRPHPRRPCSGTEPQCRRLPAFPCSATRHRR
jgi:hypothetical protein